MTELQLDQIPEFIKKASFFKPLNGEGSIIIPVYKENDEITSLEDLLLYFQVIDYCMLATRYIKFHIYQYIFDNKEEIINSAALMNYIEKYPEMHFLVNANDSCECDSNCDCDSDCGCEGDCSYKFDNSCTCYELNCDCRFGIDHNTLVSDKYYIIKCVKNNYINALKILDNYCFQIWRSSSESVSRACEIAAKNGFFNCIKYIYETHDEELHNLFDWCLSTELAASNGHLNILIYAYQHGYVFNRIENVTAAIGGHLNCLKFLHEYGYPFDDEVIEQSLYYGNFDCLKFAVDDGCHLHLHLNTDNQSYYYQLAISGNNIECFKFLHEHNCKWNSKIFEIAKKNENLDFINYMIENSV